MPKTKQDLKHQMILSELVGRLRTKNKNIIEINKEYCNKELCGEVDVLAKSLESRTYYFYEVKSCHNATTYNKAKDQFERFKQAYPHKKVKGIFVSPEYTWKIK